MFRIAEKQFRKLTEARQSDFQAKVVDYLRREFDVADQDAVTLESDVAAALADGSAFGLSSERALATYAMAAYMVGLSIKDDPQVSATLASVTLSDAVKADWLGEWLTALQTALEGE